MTSEAEAVAAATETDRSSLQTAEAGFVARLRRLVESAWTLRVITALICLNAVTLGLETSASVMAAAGDVLLTVDRIIVAIFALEIAAKLVVYRGSFFRSGWNIFDFVIVGISLAPASQSLSVLRALRILRVLRLISVVPDLRRVVQALLAAIPGMTSIVGVLLLVFYVSSVLATKLFGSHPDPNMQEWFGTIGASMYTLFQIMTLESWSMGIVRPTLELFPWAWVFFVPFIVLTSFAVLNLFIAIIVNAMQSQHEAEREAQSTEIRSIAHEEGDAILRQLEGLRADIADMRRRLDERG
ncbi:MAG: ion transporter [Alphaproteobacteria bacterium]|jgi:voltage-gated sodium channel|nr:ion transporter [Alphaproteobacteria bacterium]